MKRTTRSTTRKTKTGIVKNIPSPVRRKKSGDYFFSIIDAIQGNRPSNPIKNFLELPEVFAVVNLKARAFSNMLLKEVDEKGNDKPTPEGKTIIDLLKNPNHFQGGKEFLRQTKIYREVFGNEFIFKQKPYAMPTTSLFSIPPNLITVEYTSDKPFFLEAEPSLRYQYQYNRYEKKEIDPSLLIHFSDNRVGIKTVSDKNLYTGNSPLENLHFICQNLRAAYESRGIILTQRGANGAWVNDSADAVGFVNLDKKEKEKLEKAFERYGTRIGQRQTIVTNAPVRWVQAGTNNPKNLGLFEETMECFLRLCDVYGVPKDLFGAAQGATYENQRQAEKGFYIRTIIPEAQEWIEGIDYDLRGKDRRTKIIADFSHLDIFTSEQQPLRPA